LSFSSIFFFFLLPCFPYFLSFSSIFFSFYQGGAYNRPKLWDIGARVWHTDGQGNARETIASVQGLPIPPAQTEQILGGNLCRLLGL
jgi:hypothetical protein